jgi:hypothetical protein
MLLKALDEMPEKRLIRDELIDTGGGVCLLGAGGKAMGFADLDKIDPEDHETLAQRFNVAACLIQEIEYMNDEEPYGREETPEQRYSRVREWLTKQIK